MSEIFFDWVILPLGVIVWLAPGAVLLNAVIKTEGQGRIFFGACFLVWLALTCAGIVTIMTGESLG